MTTDFTDQEREALSEAIDIYLRDLNMEIADTDSKDYRDRLKEKRSLIQSALKRIQEPTPVMPSDVHKDFQPQSRH